MKMSNYLKVNNISLKYGKFQALNNISFELKKGKVYGLLGRNGAGKTSLLSLIASLRQATEGTIMVDDEIAFENANIMKQIAFVYETNYKEESEKVKNILKMVSNYSPNYDREYEKELIKKFKLPIHKPANKLSKGMQSVLDVIIGLASRVPISIFDESYLGMDAPTRKLFYEEVLKEQEDYPRIMILSTHLVSEMEYLFDEVLILKKGSLLLHEEYEDLVSRGTTITGSVQEIDAFVKGMNILNSQQLGSTKAVMVYEDNSQEENTKIQKEALAKGFDVTPISLQDLFIYLTEEEV